MQQGSRTDGFGKLNFQHNRPHFSAVNASEMLCSTRFCVRTLLSQDRGLKREREKDKEGQSERILASVVTWKEWLKNSVQ